MKARRYVYKRSARIEILPLIDVVFLLLAFFIYAMLSMAVHRGMTVALPESASAKIVKGRAVSVTIAEDGRLYIDESPASYEGLKAELVKRIGNQTSPEAFLFAEKTVQCQTIFSVLDEIRAAGFERVSLQAKGLGEK
ncbi:Biopolymer transporter ExbD [Candidatus Desulfarcum epimagneticum]|uniref:Biopolymer transporter ExbD n=1 Tax=uncultured Desulfobacteraceae bacterium TaxID=218296 RepID=A0A484HMS0_9BACT|nr:Biopolymer transporter ExbD [uncultured Desulfobacteraceae bacterium]